MNLVLRAVDASSGEEKQTHLAGDLSPVYVVFRTRGTPYVLTLWPCCSARARASIDRDRFSDESLAIRDIQFDGPEIGIGLAPAR